MIISPEKFQFNRTRTVAGLAGTEFLLTRAVDRPVLYRSKAFLLYTLFLLLPVGTVIYFLPAPDLIVQESSKAESQQILAHIPGTVLVSQTNRYLEPNITIPFGKVLIAEWQVWVTILAILTLQVLILLFYPYRFGPALFWVICYASLLVPAFLPLWNIGKHSRGSTSPAENLFFFFAGHQPMAWIGAALAVGICQWWCERRFAGLEQ